MKKLLFAILLTVFSVSQAAAYTAYEGTECVTREQLAEFYTTYYPGAFVAHATEEFIIIVSPSIPTALELFFKNNCVTGKDELTFEQLDGILIPQ